MFNKISSLRKYTSIIFVILAFFILSACSQPSIQHQSPETSTSGDISKQDESNVEATSKPQDESNVVIPSKPKVKTKPEESIHPNDTSEHQNSETSDISGNANQDNILSLIALKNSQASEYIYLYKVEKIDFEYNQSVLNAYLPQLNHAQSELAIAQTSMVRIYREGKGFVYEPDASKISAAQTEVDKYQQQVNYYEKASALNKETMKTLDEQLQSIRDEIRTLEESLK